MKLPTYKQLEKDYQEGRARIDVNRINHVEFIRDGVRYFCGWDSTRDPNYKPKDNFSEPYKVNGWHVYKAEPEKGGTQ